MHTLKLSHDNLIFILYRLQDERKQIIIIINSRRRLTGEKTETDKNQEQQKDL